MPFQSCYENAVSATHVAVEQRHIRQNIDVIIHI